MFKLREWHKSIVFVISRAMVIACTLSGLLFGCGSPEYDIGGIPPKIDGCEYERLWTTLLPRYALVCDQVHDFDLAATELKIREIRIKESANATHLDLSKFRNLETLKIDNGNISSLDLSQNERLTDIELTMQGLVELRLPPVQLNSLSLAEMPLLKELDTSRTQFKWLSLAGDLGFDVSSLMAHAEIWYLHLSRMHLDNLNMSRLESLRDLLLYDCEFQNLQMPGNANLQLHISGGGATDLDISSAVLGSLWLYSTNIQVLRVPDENIAKIRVIRHKVESLSMVGGASVTTLEIEDGQIQHLDISSLNSLDQLHTLALAKTQINEIPLDLMPSLSTLVITEQYVAKLDLSNNTKVEYLHIDRVYGFEELDLSHLNLGYLYIQNDDLSCDSALKIADQFSHLGAIKFHVANYPYCQN